MLKNLANNLDLISWDEKTEQCGPVQIYRLIQARN